MLHSSASESAGIPATLTQPGALKFWAAVMVTGFGAGASAAALMLLLRVVQHWAWPGPGTLLESASAASPGRHFAVLLAAGLLTGAGQMILVRLASGNGIDITEAIWFSAGRLPALRTVGSPGPRRRAKASWSRYRQCAFRYSQAVQRTTPSAGGVRRRSGAGRGLWSAAWRRVVRD